MKEDVKTSPPSSISPELIQQHGHYTVPLLVEILGDNKEADKRVRAISYLKRLGDEGVLDLVEGLDRGVLLAEPGVHARVEEARFHRPRAVGRVGQRGDVVAELADAAAAESEEGEDEGAHQEREPPAEAVEEGGELPASDRGLRGERRR